MLRSRCRKNHRRNTTRIGGDMNLPLSGFGFLFGYIVLVGTASFLEKFSMKQLNPYQVNFLMAIGMAVTAVPALWIKQGSLRVPTKSLPLGAPIGLLMALGSISFVLALSELPVGMATGIHQLRVTGDGALVDFPEREHDLDQDRRGATYNNR